MKQSLHLAFLKAIKLAFSLLCFVFLFNSKGNAQLRIAEDKDVQEFYKTKTMVVLNGDLLTDYDSVMEDAIKRFWKITPYQFIKPEEFKDYMNKKGHSFLVLTNITLKIRKNTLDFKLLNVLLAGKVKNINNMPDLGSVPILFKEIGDVGHTFYKLYSVVQFIQKNIEYLSKNPGQSTGKMVHYYNSQSKKLKDKELWLLDYELDEEINTVSKIQKVYPHKVKIVEEDELAEAIINQNKDIAFLFKVASIKEEDGGAGRCIKLIMTVDGDLLYIDQEPVNESKPDALLLRDLKKMAK